MPEKTSSPGVSLLTVLGTVFVILKLVGVIAWSWWVVLIPFYPALLAWVMVFTVLALSKDARTKYRQLRAAKRAGRRF
jgi:Transmembrane Fragile-X-F protein